ncbi:MAG TPA: PD-(D/E)XK nuclease family protein [Methylomirabilota bacterium]
MQPFLTQLAEICRTERTRAKWVIVPTHSLGHTLGERLALGTGGWTNVRFTTPLDLALPMAAPFLVERGVDPAPDDIGPALITRMLLELPSSVPTYFRGLAEQPQMAEALWAAIAELRMAGVTGKALPREAFANASKHAELQGLLESYEQHLARRRLADRADVYREALLHLDVCPIQPADLRIELPTIIWTPLERRLLDALTGARVTPRALELPGLDLPRRMATLASPMETVAPAAASNAERLALLMSPAGTPPSDGTLTMFCAGGREAEVEEVFRRIAAAGLALDQVEIACPMPEQTALIWEKAQRHEWPVTIGPGIPVAMTRPGRALIAFCEWVAGGLAASRLRRMLQSGDLRIGSSPLPSPQRGEGMELTAGQAARLLARAQATWGRQTYAAALGRLIAGSRASADDPEQRDEERARYRARAAQAERLREWTGELLALVPEQAVAPLGQWLDAAATFVKSFARKASELDGEATVALTEALADLRALADLKRPASDALGLIQGRFDGLTVGGDRARPGHLHVTTLADAGYAGRPRTFVIGLEEGGVFPALVEDPVLLDAERTRIDAALRTSEDRAGEALYRIVSRLGSLSGQVCLSYSCRDLRQARATFPSWVLLQAVRVLKPAENWTYDNLVGELGEPVSAVPAEPSQALSDGGWWLANLRGADASALPVVREAFPALEQGEVAEAARASDLFTAYDGLVPEAGPLLDPRVSGAAVSPTSLESLAKCPFAYFLQRGLGLYSTDDAEPDPDVWIDPMTRGSILHELYATIMREIRDKKETPDPAKHGARLRQLGEQALAAHRALVPPPSEGVFEREAREIQNDLALFLKFEAEDHGKRSPIGFEVAFGGATEGEALGQREPVTIDLGNGLRFKLRGRMDRIDRLPDGTYEVVDYKTGSAFLPGGLDATFARGRQLQHALYALAAVELLREMDAKAHVVGSYYFPTVRGGRERPVRPESTQAQAVDVLRDLFDLLAAGAFVHTPHADEDCRFCDFQHACGRQAAERAKAKIAKLDNAALDAYRRLSEHE